MVLPRQRERALVVAEGSTGRNRIRLLDGNGVRIMPWIKSIVCIGIRFGCVCGTTGEDGDWKRKMNGDATKESTVDLTWFGIEILNVNRDASSWTTSVQLKSISEVDCFLE